MKTFVAQSLALIGTVLVAAEAASIAARHPNKTELLRFIANEAKNMSRTPSKDLLKIVSDPTVGAVKCPACFFWGAEMSLEAIDFHNLTLTRYLHQYNKEAKTPHCHSNKKRTCTLQQLLKHIIDCAKNHK